MQKKLIMFWFLSVTLLLSACSIKPVRLQTSNVYTLNAVATNVAAQRTTHLTLLVSSPTANPGFESAAMIYTMNSYQLQEFVKNRWVAPPAQMLSPLIVDSLRNTNYFHAVVAAPFSGIADVRLDVQLLKLQQEFLNNTSQIREAIQAVLVNNVSNKIIAERRFEVVVQVANANDPYSGVVAANAATQQVLQQLTVWCIANAK